MTAAAHFDTIVIGGGSAGLAFARTAAELGARILLVERAELGGTCVNRGCVPKKILWAAGQQIRSAQGSYENGAFKTAATVDYPQLIAKRDAHIASIRASYDDRLADAGVSVVRGDATLADAHTIHVNGSHYQANQIVLATGAVPVMPGIDGANYLSNSNDVLAWTSLPRDMVILGGGYIGVEFAAIFNALGVAVTLIETGPRVLGNSPAKLAEHVQNVLVASGVTLKLNEGIETVEKINARLTYRLSSGGDGSAGAIVAATGRQPNVAQLGPFAGSLRVADSGALAIDTQFMTSTGDVYAIGDVADRLPLTPVATSDGKTLAKMLHGAGCRQIDLDLVSTTTFAYPPAAYIGTQSDEPFASDSVIRLSDAVLHTSPECTKHYYRFDADPQGHLIGAQIMADGAEDMIALMAALIAAKAPTSAFVQATGVHPSFAEEFFSDSLS